MLKPLHIETWFNVSRSWKRMFNYCSSVDVILYF